MASGTFSIGPVDREIGRLALPALGALIAQPLYVLADTAVVGHLGTPQLGGLAVATQTLLTFHAVMIFLAYGTTAAVSRLLGAGQPKEAAHQSVQGLWIAVFAGVVGAVVLWVFTTPLLRLLGAEGEILTNGRVYLRISVFGLPAMLLALAGVGYLRGLQDTFRPLVVAVITAVFNVVFEVILIYGFGFGIGASALATVVAQWLGAGMYLWWIGRAIAEHNVQLLPDLSTIRSLIVVARDLFIRTAALRGSLTVAIAAAARIGDADLAAHQVVFELWYFLALGLDAVAIAGQAIIGRYLGANDTASARSVSNRTVQWGLAVGVLVGVGVLAARPYLADIFTDDPAVASLVAFLAIHLALMQPINGIVFALDGVLIGAGDQKFLALAMVPPAISFSILALLVPAMGWGIGWLWGALWVLMVGRVVLLVWRFRGDAWLITGAAR